MPFLTAEWRKLAMIHYAVDPAMVEDYLPRGTSIDLFNGQCYLSLVGFMFQDTRILGCKLPFHTEFEEVNLRFYVRRNEKNQSKRGVVFIREIVPRIAIQIVARRVFKEPYSTASMDHNWSESDSRLNITYQWNQNGRWQRFNIQAAKKLETIPRDTVAEFFTEHYWGYNRIDNLKTIEYEVVHPRWKQYPVLDFSVDIDFGSVYGDRFRKLNEVEPDSVHLAEGSDIAVKRKNVLKFNHA